MDDANNAELQSALEHLKNMEAALERVTNEVGVSVVRHASEVIREDRTKGIPPDAREGTKQILNGKGYVADAQARVYRLKGYTSGARYQEGLRDNYWKHRDDIGAGQ